MPGAAGNPAAAGVQKGLEDVQQHLLTMHRLLNMYRPHQAREALASMLTAQLQRREQAAAASTDELQAVSALLAGAHAEIVAAVAAAAAPAVGSAAASRKSSRSRSPAPGEPPPTKRQRQAVATSTDGASSK